MVYKCVFVKVLLRFIQVQIPSRSLIMIIIIIIITIIYIMITTMVMTKRCRKLALLFVTTIRIYICQPNALALYE